MPTTSRPTTLKPDRDGALTAAALTLDDRERGWSSALFPAKPPHADTASTDMPNHDRSAEAMRSPGMCARRRQQPSHGAIVCLYRDHLSGGRDELFEHVSQYVARFRMFECEAGQRRHPTDRWQDKSREVRRGRSVEELRQINDFTRGASARTTACTSAQPLENQGNAHLARIAHDPRR